MLNVLKKKNFISTLTFAVILVAVAFSCTQVALADEVELVYPNNGYLQAENVDAIGVNNYLTVTADNENKILSYTGSYVGSQDFASFDDVVEKIFVYGTNVVLKGEKGFYSLDVKANSVTEIDKAIINDDCYLATDGNLLYVHVYGKIKVYGDGLDSPINVYENDVFNNQPVVAVDGNKIFLFESPHGISMLHIYDITTGEATTTLFEHIANAVMGEVIYAHNGTEIILVNPENLEVSVTGISTSNFTAYGDFLYIAKGADGYDKYAHKDGVLTYVGNHSFGGAGLDRLNTPQSAVSLGNELVIADTGNNRLLYVGDSVVALEINTPTAIAEGNNKLYVATLDGIQIIENKTVVSTIKTNLDVKDIVYNSGMYILAQDGVYVNIIGSLHKVFDVNNGKALHVTNLFYVLTDTGVVVARSGKNGLEKVDILSFEIDGYSPVDILADVVGNVYILGDDNGVHCYPWQKVVEGNIEGTVAQSTTILLESKLYNFTGKSMGKIGNKLVIATNENALISIDSPMVDVKENPSTIDTANSVAKTYITTDKTYFLTNDHDGTTVQKIDGGKHIVCYEVDGMLYTSQNGAKGWIFNLVDTTPTTDIAGEYIASTNIKLYVNPTTDGGVTVVKGTALTVIDNAGGYGDGNWVRVEYNGKTYYTEMSGLEKKVTSKPSTPEINKPEMPEKVNKDYGRAKSSRAGELVNLYSTQDSNIIVAKVTDGTRLEVVEKIGDFYKVKYNNEDVLIHKNQFKLDGLTTVQIIAIVLSVVVVLAGGLIFMVTSLSKKKEENQQN